MDLERPKRNFFARQLFGDSPPQPPPQKQYYSQYYRPEYGSRKPTSYRQPKSYYVPKKCPIGTRRNRMSGLCEHAKNHHGCYGNKTINPFTRNCVNRCKPNQVRNPSTFRCITTIKRGRSYRHQLKAQMPMRGRARARSRF